MLFLFFNYSSLIDILKTTQTLRGHYNIFCLVYLSAPSCHHWKPTSALHWNRICFLGYWNQWTHRAFEGFNIFSSNGRDGTPWFSAIKHLTKEELWLCRSFGQPKSGTLFLLFEQCTNTMWCLTVSPAPLPFYMLRTFSALTDHIYTLFFFVCSHFHHGFSFYFARGEVGERDMLRKKWFKYSFVGSGWLTAC